MTKCFYAFQKKVCFVNRGKTIFAELRRPEHHARELSEAAGTHVVARARHCGAVFPTSEALAVFTFVQEERLPSAAVFCVDLCPKA